jgi:hypothetical protein
MVLVIIMKKILRIIFLLLLVVSFSCEEQGLFVHCPDCFADEPVDTELEAKLELNSYTETLIQIYEGNLEDGILLGSYESASKNFRIYMPLNKEYTFTATYYLGNKKYIAVDSATPRVKYTKNQCDSPCYFVYDRIVDLRLKYTK